MRRSGDIWTLSGILSESWNKFFSARWKRMASRVVAAGVLPYDTERGFLLGRETSDGSFSGFAGFREADESPRTCAAREFFEETMGILMDQADAEDVLADVEYFEFPASLPDRVFRLYMLEIPHDPAIVPEFRKRYAQLSRLRADPKFLEKDEVRWVMSRTLRRAIAGKNALRLRPEFAREMEMILLTG